jgi:hypothetical protein
MNGQAARHHHLSGIVTLALVGVLTCVWGASAAWAQKTEYVTWTFVQGGQVFTGVAVTTGSVIVTNAAGQSVMVSAGQYTVASATTPPAPPASTATASPDVQQQIQKGEVKTAPLLVGDLKIQLLTEEPIPPIAFTPPCTPIYGNSTISNDGTIILGCR